MVFHEKRIDNWLFVAPSHKPYKKYDVYNNRTGDNITSFGAAGIKEKQRTVLMNNTIIIGPDWLLH
jgi:hypothetical protein